MKNNLDKFLKPRKSGDNLLTLIRSYEKEGWRHQENFSIGEYIARVISPKGEIWTSTKIKEHRKKYGKLEGDSLNAHLFLRTYHNYVKGTLHTGRNLSLN